MPSYMVIIILYIRLRNVHLYNEHLSPFAIFQAGTPFRALHFHIFPGRLTDDDSIKHTYSEAIIRFIMLRLYTYPRKRRRAGR